jgi:Cft2 family RNA processing exonuclease
MKRSCQGQAVFDWVHAPPPSFATLAELMEIRESEAKSGCHDYATGPIRSREQCAQIMTVLEGKTVTVSMVRTAEDKALDKIIECLMGNEFGRLILTAEADTLEYDVIREALTDIAMES